MYCQALFCLEQLCFYFTVSIFALSALVAMFTGCNRSYILSLIPTPFCLFYTEFCAFAYPASLKAHFLHAWLTAPVFFPRKAIFCMPTKTLSQTLPKCTIWGWVQGCTAALHYDCSPKHGVCILDLAKWDWIILLLCLIQAAGFLKLRIKLAWYHQPISAGLTPTSPRSLCCHFSSHKGFFLKCEAGMLRMNFLNEYSERKEGNWRKHCFLLVLKSCASCSFRPRGQPLTNGQHFPGEHASSLFCMVVSWTQKSPKPLSRNTAASPLSGAVGLSSSLCHHPVPWKVLR